MRTIKGFTIIEVLVVIVILGIVMASGSVQFRDFSRRQTVTNVKRQMIGDIRAVQSRAISGNKPTGCDSSYILVGHAFEVTGTNPARYRTYAICNNGADQVFEPKVTNITEGVTITQPAVNPIIFRPVAQGNNLNSGTSATITINNSGVNSDTITITSAGEVR